MYRILYRILNDRIKRRIYMIAINYSTIRNNLKSYCDQATDNNETIIVTRKDEKNIVIMSLEQYNVIIKNARNAEYLAKLDRSIEQLESGGGTAHDLIEADDE